MKIEAKHYMDLQLKYDWLRGQYDILKLKESGNKYTTLILIFGSLAIGVLLGIMITII